MRMPHYEGRKYCRLTMRSSYERVISSIRNTVASFFFPSPSTILFFCVCGTMCYIGYDFTAKVSLPLEHCSFLFVDFLFSRYSSNVFSQIPHQSSEFVSPHFVVIHSPAPHRNFSLDEFPSCAFYFPQETCDQSSNLALTTHQLCLIDV